MDKRLGRIVIGVVAFLAAVPMAWAGEPLPERFHFLPLTRDRSLSVKVEGTDADRPPRWQARMVVDGTLTDGRWPEHPPTVYRIGKRAYMLDDIYSGAGDFVWDAVEKKLTPIGQCYLHPVPGAGTVVIRRPDSQRPEAVEVLDFPPEHRCPRVLWSGRVPSLAPLGVWDGAVVFVLGGKRLLVLEPGWPAREIDIDVGKLQWQVTGDGIRRGKALLLGEVPPSGGDPRMQYTVSVAVINLKTRQIKPIGRIPGSWSISTNYPHPVVSASWITQKEADKMPRRDTIVRTIEGTHLGSSFVVEETDQIVK
jgi:hypothetical protein